MVDLEENRASYTIMRDNFQKRFPGYGCKRVQDTAFVDLFQPTNESGKTIRGYKYYMLIVLNGNKTVHGYGLKSKAEAPTMLATYFKDVCVPTTVVTDGAGELCSAEWKEVLRIFVCKDGTTEAYHRNQKFAEHNIETVKHMAHTVFDQSGAPTKLWCFAVDYVIDLWNHLAHSGNWRTPIERLLGHTPDISKFKLFSFYDDLKYLDSRVKFPNSKAYTGKFLGFEPDKGDTLVYRVLPDYSTKGQSTHYLVRSIVEPDSHPNHRTGLMRSLTPNREPYDAPPTPPSRSPRLHPTPV